MIICSQCHYRYFNDDLRLDCCRAEQAPISNPVTGERYCETINKDGDCEFSRPDKRFLVRGMIIIGGLLLVFILSWPACRWLERTRERQELQYQIELTEKERISEIGKEHDAAIKKEKAEQKAKFPVKIYKGTYNGKELIIEEYETYRDK